MLTIIDIDARILDELSTRPEGMAIGPLCIAVGCDDRDAVLFALVRLRRLRRVGMRAGYWCINQEGVRND